MDRVDGVSDGAGGEAIAARVRAVPSDGEANKAVVRLIADWLGVPKSCVALTAGQKSRIKTVTITQDVGALGIRLAQLLENCNQKQ